jgi:hypothetical protein
MRVRAIRAGVGMAAGVALLIVSPATVRADEPASERDTLSDWRYQSGASQSVATLPGTLVCTSEGQKPCAKFGLRVEGQTRVRPLIPGTPEVEKQIQADALRNQPVLVVGIEIPETGEVMVSGISPNK